MPRKINPLPDVTGKSALTAAKTVDDQVVINPTSGRPCKARTVHRKPVAERYAHLSPDQREKKLQANRANMKKAQAARQEALRDPARRAAVTRQGVPDGWTREAYAKHSAEIETKASAVVLELTNDADMDPRARIALEYATGVVLAEAVALTDRITAARIVLDFCKARPKGSLSVTIKTAEDFLAEVERIEGAE